MVRLAKVPIGVTENGTEWALPVAGNHVLVGGATGAGKGSVLWSLVAGLAPGIKAGLIAVRCLDPKGGMEFAAGAALFDRFAYDSDSILEVLRDTTATMLARAQRLRGTTRCHRPTRAEPHIVLLVDELASLTAYADRKQRAEVDQLLGLWLAQGRAVGVSVIAAVQDPPKTWWRCANCSGPGRAAHDRVNPNRDDPLDGCPSAGRALRRNPRHHPWRGLCAQRR